ncbi:MAG: M20/M25/M40 family metallo-hydrolase [Planctomycetia bacterium]
MRITTFPALVRHATRAALLLAAGTGPAAVAAEMMAAARASIQAADARRHVSALADDTLEGREGGSRGGRAAGSYIVSHLEKLGLEPAGDNGSWYQQFGGMRNILAIARGSDPAVANELIVVGAHNDHVGYGNAGNSYGPFGFVHNGADDNASGVAGLIEMAEAMQHLPARPRRPILFAFWDGEEKGLLGSYHFVRVRPALVAPLSIVFAVNMDMIGRLRGERLEVYGARTSEGLRAAVFRSNNRPGAAPLELAFDWAIEEDSDHYPFIAAKIPTVMFHTGLHDQYHRPSDDVQLVNFEGIEPVARLALDFVTALANDPGPPRRFRPQARQESDATRKALEAPPPAMSKSTSVAKPGDGPRPRWGIGTREDPAEPTAAVIVRITADSPAARAGMTLGDRVITIDGQEIGSQAEMVAKLAAAGDRVALEVDRKGRLVRIDMALDGAPAAGATAP